MLALKRLEAQRRGVATMIFDEVDGAQIVFGAVQLRADLGQSIVEGLAGFVAFVVRPRDRRWLDGRGAVDVEGGVAEGHGVLGRRRSAGGGKPVLPAFP